MFSVFGWDNSIYDELKFGEATWLGFVAELGLAALNFLNRPHAFLLESWFGY